MVSNMKKSSLIFGFLLGLGLIGWVAENNDRFSFIKARMQMQTMPVQMIASVKTGAILRKLGLLEVIPNDYTHYGNRLDSVVKKKPSIFNIKRSVGVLLYSINGGLNTKEPTPTIPTLSTDQITDGIPTLSLKLDDNDLYDQKIGLIPNALKRGRKWERPAILSYYKQSDLVFTTGVGVRMHGGSSRKKGRSKAYRLYFREVYGENQFKPGVIFDRSSEPLKCLIIVKSHFNIPFAYNIAMDIATKIGCVVPQNQVIKLYINGEKKGIYSLFERFDVDFLKSHYGHQNFVYARTKRGNDPDPIKLKHGPVKPYRDFLAWVNQLKRPVTMEGIGKIVDLNNLCRWLISVIFCETIDAFQGNMVLDLSDPSAKWFWTNWDMNGSFFSVGKLNYPKMPVYYQDFDFFDYIFKNKGDERIVLFRALIEDSAEFREFFKEILDECLYERLTPEFLRSLLAYYEQFLVLLNDQRGHRYKELYHFLSDRHKLVRKKIQQYYRLSE
jgi:hypothetical protein